MKLNPFARGVPCARDFPVGLEDLLEIFGIRPLVGVRVNESTI